MKKKEENLTITRKINGAVRRNYWHLMRVIFFWLQFDCAFLSQEGKHKTVQEGDQSIAIEIINY